MLKILVTGANGLVGQAVCRYLAHQGYAVRALLRNQHFSFAEVGIETVHGFDLKNFAKNAACLKGVDVVIHCAARVHVMKEKSHHPLQHFREVNVEGTRALAEACVVAGVKQFIFLSSIKVNAESTSPGQALTEDSWVNPQDPYAISKYEAEELLLKGYSQKMACTILRLPLVYSPEAKGNLAGLRHWIASGLPIPLASVQNARSLVDLPVLCTLIEKMIQHPEHTGVFLVANRNPVSTPDLIRKMANDMHRPAFLIHFPVRLLNIALSLLGKRAIVDRLCGSLVVDSCRAQSIFNWDPNAYPPLFKK